MEDTITEDKVDALLIKAAWRKLHSMFPGIISYPEEATISYPEFNPYRATQPLAVITFPVIHCLKSGTEEVFLEEGEQW
jgi:hypothetical protein